MIPAAPPQLPPTSPPPRVLTYSSIIPTHLPHSVPWSHTDIPLDAWHKCFLPNKKSIEHGSTCNLHMISTPKHPSRTEMLDKLTLFSLLNGGHEVFICNPPIQHVLRQQTCVIIVRSLGFVFRVVLVEGGQGRFLGCVNNNESERPSSPRSVLVLERRETTNLSILLLFLPPRPASNFLFPWQWVSLCADQFPPKSTQPNLTSAFTSSSVNTIPTESTRNVCFLSKWTQPDMSPRDINQFSSFYTLSFRAIQRKKSLSWDTTNGGWERAALLSSSS